MRKDFIHKQRIRGQPETETKQIISEFSNLIYYSPFDLSVSAFLIQQSTVPMQTMEAMAFSLKGMELTGAEVNSNNRTESLLEDN